MKPLTGKMAYNMIRSCYYNPPTRTCISATCTDELMIHHHGDYPSELRRGNDAGPLEGDRSVHKKLRSLRCLSRVAALASDLRALPVGQSSIPLWNGE